MKFNYCFLKKRFLLLLIALGIGSVLYANNELKLLTDSLRRVIDEKHVFVKEKEDRINRIKCMLRSPGLTLEGEYRINLRLYNEYKKFHIDSAIHYVDRNIEISRQLNKPLFHQPVVFKSWSFIFDVWQVSRSGDYFEKYKDFRTSQRFINKLLSNLFQLLGTLFDFCRQQSVWQAAGCLSRFVVCPH